MTQPSRSVSSATSIRLSCFCSAAIAAAGSAIAACQLFADALRKRFATSGVSLIFREAISELL